MVIKNRRLLIEGSNKKDYKSFLLEFDGGSTQLEKCRQNPDIPIYLTGIIQKGDAPNRNGRIYPFDILRKECERYLAEEVKEGQSFSELDHPCLDNQHFIYTINGWKSIVDVVIGDVIATMNPESKEFEWKPVLKKIDDAYKGKMYKMHNNVFSAVVTPNHKFLVFNRLAKNKKLEFKTAKELVESKYYKIAGEIEWQGKDLGKIKIDGLEKIKGSYSKFADEDLFFDAEYFMKFLGWFITEGYTKHNANTYTIGISQSKEEGKKEIRDILNNLEINFNEYNGRNNERKNESDFKFDNKRLCYYLKNFGEGAKNKCLTKEIKELSPRLLEILIDTMLKGDGHGEYFYTSSKQLADDFCEILIKCGYGISLTEKESYREDYTIQNVINEEIKVIDSFHWYTKKDYKNQNRKNYQITKKERIYTGEKFYTVRRKERTTYDVDSIKFDEFDFNDRIYCVEVENHTFLTMRDGKITWTGNSESTVPELKNAAATVEDIWFKGTEVWGKVKLLNAYTGPGDPAYKARSIVLNEKVLGISSRALGSVYSDKNGYDVVEDDLEIICWDLVSRPSTYNANLKLTEAIKKKGEILTEAKCFGGNCNIKTSKQIIKEKKLLGLTTEEKVFLECMGVEKFLQIKKQISK